MGNVTRVPGRGEGGGIVAFDTGPGNALVDAAVHRATGGREVMDRDGRRATRGTVDSDLLGRLLDHPFFGQEPPRSTGREVFGPVLVAGLADEAGLEPGDDGPGWEDLIATLTALTVESVARALRRWVVPVGVEEVVVTGGGARNPVMVAGLRQALDPLPVRVGREALGMDPDAREAAAFAVLAWAHLRGIPANVPRATGASGSRILGSLTPAPGRPGRGAGSSGPRDGTGGHS
jgi:anhydro-N-acetylmuramic acid kinase